MAAIRRGLSNQRCFGSSSHIRIALFLVLVLMLLRSLFPAVGLDRIVPSEKQEWRPGEIPGGDSEASHLLSQVREQQEIQKAIWKNQHPDDCETTRLLLRGGGLRLAKDGFASELQYIARLLQIAVSTRRALVLTPAWRSAYEPTNCPATSPSLANRTQSGWICIWQPLTACNSVIKAPKGDAVVPFPDDDLEYPAGHGILPERLTSNYFHTGYYGPLRVAWAPNSFKSGTELADILSHVERARGRFWVRAQMAHYLWRPAAWLQQEIELRKPPELATEPFIGFHIRKTDNIVDFKKAFGRNATATRSFDRFMAFAEHIRALHPDKKLKTIFLATDNTAVIADSKRDKWRKAGWKFVFQSDVQRSTTRDRMWFREGRNTAAAGIGADLEILRRADFLVGSFQSNVYRLAAELNTAWHAGNYSWSLRRHSTVDVEWYEDP